MSLNVSQITGVAITCSTVCFYADQRKDQSSASLAHVRGIHRWKKFLFDDVTLRNAIHTDNQAANHNLQ